MTSDRSNGGGGGSGDAVPIPRPSCLRLSDVSVLNYMVYGIW